MNRRRGIALGLAVVIAGTALEWRKIFGPHFKPTPYDDLLGQLTDRETAARLGTVALKSGPGFTAPGGAAELRTALGQHGLSAAAVADAKAGRTLEVSGWLMPRSVALLAALAAKA